jgi:endo-1,4-beta-D-glucanase Y
LFAEEALSMRRSRVLVCIRAAILVLPMLPMAVACSSSPSPGTGDGTGDNNSGSNSGGNNNSGNGSGGNNNSGNGSGGNNNSGNGSGGNNNSGNGSGGNNNSGNGSGGNNNSGNGSGGNNNSGNGSGGNNNSSNGSSGNNNSGNGSGSGNAGNSSGSGNGGTSSGSSSGNGSGAATSDAGASACGTPSANMISDFEQDTGSMIAQGGRTGYWYVFADTVAGTQTPAANANGPIAVAAAPTGDPIPTGETCNKYALSSTSTGHTMYSGVGAAFSPSAGMMRAAYDLSAYDGIQFDVETTQSSEGAVYFEMLTKESQPGPAYAAANPGTVATGTAVNGSVDAYNNRGYLLAGVGQTPTGVGTALTTSFQTVYVPFSLLVPFYFPDLTACGTTKPCQAPNFVPTNALAFQFNATADFTSTGGYNLWVDNVSLYKGDNGLTPPGITMPTFNDGAKNFASCKGAIPTFAGGRTAAGKYLLWAYRNWKEHFVVASGGGFKVVRPDPGDNNDTVSEGIGYGMLLAVYFNDKTLFDGLWAYEQQNTATGLLMTWDIPNGMGSATDADEDMAFALVEAGKQWDPSYTTTAGTMISQIGDNDIDWTNNLPTGGSNYGNSTTSHVTNPSYFAPAYYRVFAGIDKTMGHNWMSLADNTITVISSLAGSNGLVPAWCSGKCTAAAVNMNSTTDEIYQYDAQRVPWRIGVDYCWSGTSSAASYLSKVSAFFAGQAAGGIGALYDEYELSGAPYTGAVANSMSLIGSAAVGAMSGSNSSFVNEAWQFVLDGINRGKPNIDPTKNTYYTYYNATVGLLTALTMSGNFYSM